MTSPADPVRAAFEEAAETLRAFVESPEGLARVPSFVEAAAATVEAGGLLMACGNGGSLCDAMHFAEEWTGRFRKDRRAVPAVAFSDPSHLTCIANDFGYDEVFAREVAAYGKRGDLLLAISTSGESPNVIRAVEAARELGVTTVGLLGKGGGRTKALVDVAIVVPRATTSDRIQEVHIKVIHTVIEAVERRLFPENYAGAADVYDELARDADKFSGISHARIDAKSEGKTGLQWPCPDESHPGTEYLHSGGVLRGKGLFQAVEYRPSDELPDEEYALVLSTGRTLYHYNAATQTRREPGLAEKQSENFVEIHPRDAKKRGIADGDLVEVRTRRGAVEIRALLSRQVRPGCIWIPLHFAEARANLLTNSAGDTTTGTAEYKVCAAEVKRVAAATGDTLYPGSFYRVDGPGGHGKSVRADAPAEHAAD